MIVFQYWDTYIKPFNIGMSPVIMRPKVTAGFKCPPNDIGHLRNAKRNQQRKKVLPDVGAVA